MAQMATRRLRLLSGCDCQLPSSSMQSSLVAQRAGRERSLHGLSAGGASIATAHRPNRCLSLRNMPCDLLSGEKSRTLVLVLSQRAQTLCTVGWTSGENLSSCPEGGSLPCQPCIDKRQVSPGHCVTTESLLSYVRTLHWIKCDAWRLLL